MSKRKSSDVKSRHGQSIAENPAGHEQASPAVTTAGSHVPSGAAIRETIESVVVAFVLAFLFRTFEAEAFVIPTGSMAPTLMGRHKDLNCPECQYPYQVSASDKTERNGEEAVETPAIVGSATCPMCRYTADLGHGSYPSYNGDRILVSKFCYQFEEPKRWDVVVFHYPDNATQNFIKRLVGLPGETVRISHGALWIRQGNDVKKPFEIARKPPPKLLATLQPVFDNDLTPAIRKHGWPARWSGSDWTSSDGATFEAGGKAAGEAWLRYRHLVPSFEQWHEMMQQGALQTPLRTSLISDFVAYNTGREQYEPPGAESLGMHWVGDLAVECTLDSHGDAGQVVFELVKGGRQFRCRIDLASGRAAFSISGPDTAAFRPTAATALSGRGSHRVMFSNAEDQLLLWVDGSLVMFDAPTSYDSRVLGDQFPQAADLLSPAGIASQGADVTVSHLKLLRDNYYIAEKYPGRDRQPITDYTDLSPDLADPLTWDRFRDVNQVEFPLGPDQFFVLGDNSAQSKDGRLWGSDHWWVSRDLLIGKALFIYWPHSWDKVTILGKDIPFPFFPNFRKMGFVR
jgi:signal peptidase I